MLIKLNQTGDTIIEVLIAIAIIGVVLAGGFAVTNYSLNTEQNSQERDIAIGILQSQIEQLRSLTTPPDNPLPGVYTWFCMVGNPMPHWYGYVDPKCLFDASGKNMATSEPVFNVKITYSPASSPTTPNVYWARVKWNALGGGVDHIDMFYRLYYN